MSQNDVIIVARFRGRYYVLGPLNADTQWCANAILQIIENTSLKKTRDRGKALVLAHNLQKRKKTEHGVWELNVGNKVESPDWKQSDSETNSQALE